MSSEVYKPEIPENWEAAGGERGQNNYTKWFYNPFEGLELVVYWDAEPGDDEHTIIVDKEIENDDGDIIDRKRKYTSHHDSEDDAMRKAEKVMDKFNEVDG